MAFIRASMIFRYSTGTGRPAGMSESWYYSGDMTQAMTALKSLCNARSALLPAQCSIVGQRLQDVSNTVRSLTDNQIFPGAARGLEQDAPQIAVQCLVKTLDESQSKNFSMRMMPDDAVFRGDFTPGVNFPLALFSSFATSLVTNGMRWRARRFTNPKIAIISVAADGTFLLAQDLDYVQGDSLTLLRVKNTNGRSVTGNYYVQTRTDARNGKFANWGGSIVAGKGFVRKLNFDYPLVGLGKFKVIRSMVRKVGRPLDLYRGRATKTR